MFNRCQNALILGKLLGRLPQDRLQAFQSVLQERQGRFGSEWEQMLKIAKAKAPVLMLNLQLPALQDSAILCSQNWQQDFVPQFLLDRLPVDIEESRKGRTGTVLEYIPPPGVL